MRPGVRAVRRSRSLPVLVAGLLLPLAAAPAAGPPGPAVDLQAHRGGAGLAVESSLLSFGTALDPGVHTLELDVQITRDGHAVVTHDRRTTPDVCRGTRPATPDDPAFPTSGATSRT